MFISYMLIFPVTNRYVHVLVTACDMVNLLNVINYAFYEILDLHAQSKKLYMIYLYCKHSIITLCL